MIKNYIAVGVLLLLIVIVSFTKGKNKGFNEASKAYEAKIDTLNHYLAKAPDTVKTSDTIYIEKSVLLGSYMPEIRKVVNDTIYYYDTIKDDNVSIWIADRTGGSILDRQLGYDIKVPHIIDTIWLNKEVPVFVNSGGSLKGRSYICGQIGFRVYGFGYGRFLDEKQAVGLNTLLIDGNPTISINYTRFFKSKR